MALTGKLYDEDPYMAELFTKGFALPQNTYAEANANYRQGLAIGAQREQQAQNFNNDLMKLRQIQEFDWKKQKDMQKYNENMALLKNSLKNTGISSDQMSKELNFLTQALGDEKKAAELYLYQHYDKALKALQGDNEILKDDAKFFNFTDGYFGAIEYYIKSVNNGMAKQMIEQFQSSITNGDFKYAEQMNSARVNGILTQLDMFAKVANGEMTLEEMQKLMQGDTGKPFHEYDSDAKANAEAKRIGEEKARELREREEKRRQIEQNRRSLNDIYQAGIYGSPILSNPNPQNFSLQPQDFYNPWLGQRVIINP